jgi:hypothetical protein
MELDKLVEIAKKCKYLPENDLKQLCDLVCDLLLEESNIQPVSTPVTVCGDIHGQVRKKKSSSPKKKFIPERHFFMKKKPHKMISFYIR